MEPRRFSVTPGGSSGNGGGSVGNTSSRRRSRMSDPPSVSHLLPLFNTAAADGGGFGSSWLELALDEWRLRNIRFPPLHEAPPTPPPTPHQVARLFFLASPMSSPAADDNVLIMDGVLIGNSGSRMATSTRSSVSFSGPGLVAAGSPGSSGGSSCGSNGQVTGSSSLGGGSRRGYSIALLVGLLGSGLGGRFGSNGQFARGRAMRPRFSEVASPNTGRSSIGSLNMQRSPITPPLPGPAFPTAVSSYTDAAVTIWPPASYFTLPRVTASAARPSPSTREQAETEPFAWPPTTEEDASFAQQLYGSTTGARRRLPVFEAICPAEAE